MKHRILVVADSPLAPKARTLLQAIGTVTVLNAAKRNIRPALKRSTILIVGPTVQVAGALLKAAPHLQLIGCPSTGIDHVDAAAARKRGIAVVSLKGDPVLRNITGTAELAWGLAISLLRTLPEAAQSVRRGHWHREKFLGTTLSGKTLGIVGLGRLGSLVARYGKAFGMRVLATNDVRKPMAGVTSVPLQKLLRQSDLVSLHVPLDDGTRRMIGRTELRQMKRTALLINTARGGIVDERAVLHALKEQWIAGYGADVLEGEASFAGTCRSHPLAAFSRTHGNVLITPHIGGMTKEGREITDVRIAEKILHFLGTRKRRNS